MFVEKLQHSGSETLFVPGRAWKQGSPSNPFLSSKRVGYYCEVEPPKLATALMTWREQLAEEWCVELHAFANAKDNCVFRSELADAQLLEGIATRIAIREMLSDLSLLPSKSHTCEWLRHFLNEHKDGVAMLGSVENLLLALRAEPLMIKDNELLDPLQLADELRSRTVLIATDMASALEATCLEHQQLKCNFLERCFVL